jgi:signal transduction histidine kinase
LLALRSLLHGCVAVALLVTALAGAAHAQEVAIRTVEWAATAPGAAPKPDAQWTRFELPLRWTAREDSALQGVALRATFELTKLPEQPWAVLLPRASDGGRVSINGRVVGAIRSPSDTTHVRWRRPHLLAIDPSLLVKGANTLLIETAYRGGSHELAPLRLGPLDGVSHAYEAGFFLNNTVAWIGATLAAVVALLFGVLWLRRPEPLLALLTIGALLWIGRSADFLVEVVPLGLRFWLQLLYYVSIGGFAAVMSIAILRMCARARLREEYAIFGYAAIGPLLVLVAPQEVASFLNSAWQGGLLLIAAGALWLALYNRTRRRESPHGAVIAATVLALAAALHDVARTLGWLATENVHLLHFAGPLLLIAMATPLVDRFVRVLGEAETARAELETRVREREQLLKRNFERLRESERAQATAQERQRIMQDMHDGLGSQLLSSLMLVERGALTGEQLAQILRESIDDMRLAIDALAAEDADLLSALGNLRFRMEPRLRAAGIELLWDARKLPVEIDINPDAVLPILRIVQEALTNSLKHSRARAVSVVLGVENASVDSQWLVIRITDNGRGITEERVGGRGLLNMRNRAARIGAQLKLETVPGAGTMVQLRYKVEPGAGQGRTTQLGMNTQAILDRAREAVGMPPTRPLMDTDVRR